MTLSSTVMQAWTVNENKRIYPRVILQKIADDMRQKINNGNAFGAIGAIGMPPRDTLQLTDISHRIIKCEMNGSFLIAEAEILDMPEGRRVKEMIDGGEKLTIRPSGIGTLSPPDKDGVQIINDDYTLISLNIVKQSDAS